MPESLDALRRTVLNEVREQRHRRTVAPARRDKGQARTLGMFIEVCLERLGLGDTQFASALDVEPEVAEAILDGDLPESEIDDGLLRDIARVIQHDPNLLRLMLGRQPVLPRRSADAGGSVNSADA